MDASPKSERLKPGKESTLLRIVSPFSMGLGSMAHRILLQFGSRRSWALGSARVRIRLRCSHFVVEDLGFAVVVGEALGIGY